MMTKYKWAFNNRQLKCFIVVLWSWTHPSEQQHLNVHRHNITSTQLPALVNYWHVTKQAVINFVNLVKLCFHWLMRSDFTAVIGQRVHTRVYTHTHSNKQFALLPALSCLAGIISSYRVPKGQRWPPLGSTHFMCFRSSMDMCVCVSVCAVNMTAWPLWWSFLSWRLLPYISTI